LSYRVAHAPALLDLIEEPLDQIAVPINAEAEVDRVLTIGLGGMFAHAPCSATNALIQSASYPRSASNRACRVVPKERFRLM
jgi:hypothetical protein